MTCSGPVRLALLLSAALVGQGAGADSPGPPAGQAVADLYVVDCLLPGQVRQLGQRTYLTPRRPTRTTAADCRIRGGEYVAYDRADYKSALKVWMEAAQAGDVEAQVTVGEIYERGLGGEPNYAAALLWYEKAARQGSSKAQFALGAMYEQGLGVERDTLTALNWYRQAWGVPEDNLIFESAANREAAQQREALEKEVAAKSAQIEVLEKQVRSLREKLSQDSAAAGELSTLEALVDDLQRQLATSTASLDRLPTSRTREPESQPVATQFKGTAEKRIFRDLEVGSSYALLIGNQSYQQIDDLATPINDVERAAGVLRDKYGFEVRVVSDGDNVTVMRAINDLNDVLKEEDNLLIFYAGHGTRLHAGETEVGYWLPSNAEPPPRDTFWVSNEFVTGHLSRLKARRVLVVADSCYAGLLSSEPSMMVMGDVESRYANPEFLRFKLDKRSRLLLTSGGDQPVLDEGSGGHSVFANAFIDELEKNQDLLSAPQLFLRIRDRVVASAHSVDFEQVPDFKVIKSAGHDVGDFFFFPLAVQ